MRRIYEVAINVIAENANVELESGNFKGTDSLKSTILSQKKKKHKMVLHIALNVSLEGTFIIRGQFLWEWLIEWICL